MDDLSATPSPEERARLDAARRLGLFSDFEDPILDTLVRLGAADFGVGACLITVADADAHVFRARYGASGRSVPRPGAFCEAIVRSGRPLIVLDARAHAAFRANPLVTGSEAIRFYAGAPMRTRAGLTFGTFCLLDTQPRASFSPEDVARLETLAATAALVTLHAADAELTRRESAAARERLQLLELAERASGIGSWSWHAATDTVTWSAVCAGIHGLPADRPAPSFEAMKRLYHPDDAERLQLSMNRALEDGAEILEEIRMRTGAGADRRFVVCATRHAADDGRIVGLVGTVQDVTELRALDAAMRGREALLSILTERTTDVVLQFDRNGVIQYASPSVRHFGYDPDSLVGRPGAELQHPDDRAATPSLLAGAAQPAERGVFRTRLTSGESRWVDSNPVAILDETGAPNGYVAVIRDVTDRLALEDELRRKEADAAAAASAKGEFLANMSHEIRTPLTAVIGFAGLLEKLDLPTRARGYVRRIATSGQALLAIVDDILEFSRMEDGRIRLEPAPFDPGEHLLETIALIRPQAQARGLALEVRPPATPAPRLTADARRLRQVLVNLIGNAIKFTERGAVTVSLAHDPHAGALVYEVADTGPGIREDLLPKLFERFSQGDPSAGRRQGGAGLGLAISKGLVERMGGTISVRNAAPGAIFRIEVPAAPAEAPRGRAADEPRAPAPASAPRGPLRLLVVDDVPANRDLIRALLSALEAEVTVAESGAEAVSAAMTTPFDAILMDLHMPGMDGLEATAAIRRGDGANRRTPVLALSANVMPEMIAACAEAGMDGHIAKPIDPETFLGRIADCLEKRAPSPVGE